MARPKRPLSAYNFYFSEKRAELAKQAAARHEPKKLKLVEVSKLIGRQWKQTSQRERKKYERMARDEYEQYMRKVADWKKRRSTQRKRLLQQKKEGHTTSTTANSGKVEAEKVGVVPIWDDHASPMRIVSQPLQETSSDPQQLSPRDGNSHVLAHHQSHRLFLERPRERNNSQKLASEEATAADEISQSQPSYHQPPPLLTSFQHSGHGNYLSQNGAGPDGHAYHSPPSPLQHGSQQEGLVWQTPDPHHHQQTQQQQPQRVDTRTPNAHQQQYTSTHHNHHHHHHHYPQRTSYGGYPGDMVSQPPQPMQLQPPPPPPPPANWPQPSHIVNTPHLYHVANGDNPYAAGHLYQVQYLCYRIRESQLTAPAEEEEEEGGQPNGSS